MISDSGQMGRPSPIGPDDGRISPQIPSSISHLMRGHDYSVGATASEYKVSAVMLQLRQELLLL